MHSSRFLTHYLPSQCGGLFEEEAVVETPRKEDMACSFNTKYTLYSLKNDAHVTHSDSILTFSA